MPEIIRVKDKLEIFKNTRIFSDYISELNIPGTEADLLIRLFTSFDDPGTFFLMAFDDGKAVGFLVAAPVKEPKGYHLRISEWFSKIPGIGVSMFQSAIAYAGEMGFSSVKGLVRNDRVKTVKKMLGATMEAALLSVELKNE